MSIVLEPIQTLLGLEERKRTPNFTLTFSDGVQRLVPRSAGKFGINDPEAPDWIAFESIVSSRAMRLNFSGIVFRRTFTP